MQILEHFYENPPKPEHFFPRKATIAHAGTCLQGPPLSGKTSIMIDFLQTCGKNYLYLNMHDLRLQNKALDHLPRFVTQEGIQLLAVDNYEGDFTLPDIDCVLSCQRPVQLAGFDVIEVHPFDFEEFLATSQGSQTQAFNAYLKAGSKDEIGYQRLAKAFLGDRINVFMHLCNLCAKPISINQVYLQLKQYTKISKDWLYKSISHLEAEGFIYFLSKHGAPRAAKKVFITNQEFVNVLGMGVGFINIFQNLVVNELIKKGLTPLYLEQSSYLIGDTLLKVEPFASEEASWVRMQKHVGSYSKAGIKRTIIITISSDFAFEVGSLPCEAMPFYEWALLDE
ncbi:MAG: hypothetical protein ACQERK_00470 [Campylobacterota bacterium]